MFQGEGSMDDLGGPVKIGMVIGDAVRSGIARAVFPDVFHKPAAGYLQFTADSCPGRWTHLHAAGRKIQGRPFEHSLAGKDSDGWFFITDFPNDFVTWNDLMSLL